LKTLQRGITRLDFVSLIINITIGAGILGLPAKVNALLGSYSIFAFVVCAIFIALIMLCFAEVGSRFSLTGGPYLYALQSFSPFIGFQAGWLLWLSRLFAFASVSNLLVDYASFFYVGIAMGWSRTFFIALLVASLGVLNWIGIRAATIVNNIITFIKVLVLIAFILVESFAQATLLLVFAFSGFDVAAVPAGEVHHPHKNVPFALGIALLIVTLIYIGIQVVAIGTLPELSTSTTPLAEATYLFAGKGGAVVLTIGAIITILGTMNVLVLTCSRLLFAMAEQKQLPALLANIHPRFQTPSIALLISTSLLLVITLLSNFIQALSISALIRLFTFVTTALAVFILRKKQGAAPFQIRYPFVIVALAVVLCVGLLWYSNWKEVEAVAVLAAIGYFIFGSYQWWQKSKQELKQPLH
jgi:basic amino acid/polyamine antiporter, APA family